ncbi:MAG: metallophosphoesterase [Promethearchaeota archaeon]
MRTPEQEKFYLHLRKANQVESKNPLTSLEELRICYKILKYQKLNLPNEKFMLQQITNRINYLIDKLGDIAYNSQISSSLQKSSNKIEGKEYRKEKEKGKEKKGKEGEEEDFNVKTDISDMEQRLEKLEQDYEKRLNEIKSNEDLTKKEKKKQEITLTKWKKDQELKILTEKAMQERAEIEAANTKENVFETKLEHEVSESTNYEKGGKKPESKASKSKELSEKFDDLEISNSKPMVKSLAPTEMEKIWEYYFLHAFNHPTPDEYYGNGEAKQFILQMLTQISKIYERFDPKHVNIDNLPGDSKIYFVGDILGSFEALDRLMRFFQPKIFEAQATENPLRLVFLGNFIGGTEMDLHSLLYLICFNILYPNEVILCRGTHEEQTKFNRLKLKKFILEHFDQEIIDAFYEFYTKLPIAYYIESPYRLIFAMHGYLPIDLEKSDTPLAIFEQEFQASQISIKEMDSITQQVIANIPALRMNKETMHSAISGSVGLKINQALFEPFIQANNIELMVVGNHNIKNGHRVYYNNRLIGLVSALEYKGKQIKGKILEIIFPPEPENEEEYIEDGDEEEYTEDGDEEEFEKEELPTDKAVKSDSLFGSDEKNVQINLIDISKL